MSTWVVEILNYDSFWLVFLRSSMPLVPWAILLLSEDIKYPKHVSRKWSEEYFFAPAVTSRSVYVAAALECRDRLVYNYTFECNQAQARDKSCVFHHDTNTRYTTWLRDRACCTELPGKKLLTECHETRKRKQIASTRVSMSSCDSVGFPRVPSQKSISGSLLRFVEAIRAAPEQRRNRTPSFLYRRHKYCMNWAAAERRARKQAHFIGERRRERELSVFVYSRRTDSVLPINCFRKKVNNGAVEKSASKSGMFYDFSSHYKFCRSHTVTPRKKTTT